MGLIRSGSLSGLPGAEKLLKFAAVKPNSVTVRAGVEDYSAIDAAVDAQQLRGIAGAKAFFPLQVFLHRSAPQRSHVLRIFGEKLGELASIKPTSVA